MNKHISSIASGVALGSAGVVMMGALTGCEAPQQQQEQQSLHTRSVRLRIGHHQHQSITRNV